MECFVTNYPLSANKTILLHTVWCQNEGGALFHLTCLEEVSDVRAYSTLTHSLTHINAPGVCGGCEVSQLGLKFLSEHFDHHDHQM